MTEPGDDAAAHPVTPVWIDPLPEPTEQVQPVERVEPAASTESVEPAERRSPRRGSRPG